MTSSAGNPASNPGPPYADARVPVARDAVPRRSLIGQALLDTFGDTGARLGACWIVIVAVIAVFAPFLANSHPILYRLKGGELDFPLVRHLTAIDVILLMLFIHAVLVILRKTGAGMTLALIVWPVATVGYIAGVASIAASLLTFSLYRPATADSSGLALVLAWLIWVVVHLLLIAVVAGLGWLLWKSSVSLFRAAIGGNRYRSLWISGVTFIVLSLASAYFIRPPSPVVYEEYRQAEAAGQTELVVRTIIPYSPNDRLRDHPEETLTPPGVKHWLGTTNYSEDMLSRMIHACRVALAIGLIATSIATLIGVAVGGLMGYYVGKLDLIGMRIVEIFEAIPTLILLLIVTVSIGRNLYLIMVVIGLLSWMSDARFIRAEFFRIRNLDYVQAAIAAGLGRFSIIFRHMLPNGVAPVLVNASFGIAGAILLESTLSFLGLGLGPDDPSWGQLLEQARSGGTGFSWWIATFPGLAIFLTVFSYILIGEAMRDAIDPKLKKSQG